MDISKKRKEIFINAILFLFLVLSLFITDLKFHELVGDKTDVFYILRSPMFLLAFFGVLIISFVAFLLWFEFGEEGMSDKSQWALRLLHDEINLFLNTFVVVTGIVIPLGVLLTTCFVYCSELDDFDGSGELVRHFFTYFFVTIVAVVVFIGSSIMYPMYKRLRFIRRRYASDRLYEKIDQDSVVGLV